MSNISSFQVDDLPLDLLIQIVALNGGFYLLFWILTKSLQLVRIIVVQRYLVVERFLRVCVLFTVLRLISDYDIWLILSVLHY